LLAVTFALIVAYPFVPRIPQPLSYHNFADHRSWLGIPNLGDVTSNVLFAVFGALGLGFLASRRSRQAFIDQRERWPYFFIFLGMVWTAFGSGYYHLAPSNSRLVWDRLPMTIVFMPLVAAMIMERLNLAWGLRSLPILLAVGIASVVQWNLSELRGAGDLRFYAAVQLYSVLAVLILFFVPSRYTQNSDIGWVIVFYVLAKILEDEDRAIFRAGGIVSGHTLKHLAAGMAGFFLLRMLQKREPSLAQAKQI
jgi:tryptophan-rich sensory protein